MSSAELGLGVRILARLRESSATPVSDAAPGTSSSSFSYSRQLSTHRPVCCAGGLGETPQSRPVDGLDQQELLPFWLGQTRPLYHHPTHTLYNVQAAMRPCSSRPPLSPCRPARPTTDPLTLTQGATKVCPMVLLSPRAPGLFWEQGRKACHPSGKNQGLCGQVRDGVSRSRDGPRGALALGSGHRRALALPSPAVLSLLKQIIWPS